MVDIGGPRVKAATVTMGGARRLARPYRSAQALALIEAKRSCARATSPTRSAVLAHRLAIDPKRGSRAGSGAQRSSSTSSDAAHPRITACVTACVSRAALALRGERWVSPLHGGRNAGAGRRVGCAMLGVDTDRSMSYHVYPARRRYRPRAVPFGFLSAARDAREQRRGGDCGAESATASSRATVREATRGCLLRDNLADPRPARAFKAAVDADGAGSTPDAVDIWRKLIAANGGARLDSSRSANVSRPRRRVVSEVTPPPRRAALRLAHARASRSPESLQGMHRLSRAGHRAGASEVLSRAAARTAWRAPLSARRRRARVLGGRFRGVRRAARLPARRPAPARALEELRAPGLSGGQGIPGRILRAPCAGTRYLRGRRERNAFEERSRFAPSFAAAVDTRECLLDLSVRRPRDVRFTAGRGQMHAHSC